ncbi:related to gEgh 16 protein [Phialocephala subalpina]|uniref:Related to gEgh 16 protein n=1 Tax=Phialocephala subalpina TaxID=576137 RepID=A0A1L7XV85_9HELO|nr:related to gEgh 16 protein [Phialocephala subalpina]
MYTGSILVLALSAASIVSAHGKVTVVQGNLGGNGTALGIKGASVATFGKNAATELDTTVFGGNANDPTKDGLGKTAADGAVKTTMLKSAVAQSGNTLPQVSADGTGTITGTWRIVTSDGTANNAQGDLFAVIDSTGTGAYSTGTQLTATSDMVGNGQGNVVQRSFTKIARALGKRATNPFSVKIPAGTTCTGTDATTGMTNFCLMKIANNNGAGPFGGSIAFQVAGAGAAAGNTTTAASTTTAKAATAKGNKAAKRFEA